MYNIFVFYNQTHVIGMPESNLAIYNMYKLVMLVINSYIIMQV